MHGLINVLKPPGMTSHDVVAHVRRLTRAKAGHTGTLDPAAAGVLPVCLGQATRIIEYLPGDKKYRAEVVFGVATDSGDMLGRVVRKAPDCRVTRQQVEKALHRFCGPVEQVPPMTSAVHYQGRRLYELARQGLEVERPVRLVHIYSIELADWYSVSHRPAALLDVHCSAGTYIRTLCQDLGEYLGCGATLNFLLRTAAGPCCLVDALTLEEVAQLAGAGQLSRVLVGLGEALAHLPPVEIKTAAKSSVLSGAPLYPAGVRNLPAGLKAGDLVRLVERGQVLAVARAGEHERGLKFVVQKVFAPVE